MEILAGPNPANLELCSAQRSFDLSAYEIRVRRCMSYRQDRTTVLHFGLRARRHKQHQSTHFICDMKQRQGFTVPLRIDGVQWQCPRRCYTISSKVCNGTGIQQSRDIRSVPSGIIRSAKAGGAGAQHWRPLSKSSRFALDLEPFMPLPARSKEHLPERLP